MTATVESAAPDVEDDASTQSAEPRPRVRLRTRWLRPALAVVVPTAAVGVHASYYGAWIEDDAGITFAYARSIATGSGFVLQPGAAPVEGYSNPLWLAIMVVGRWLGLFDHGAWFGVPDLVWFPKLVALTCCAGIFACFYFVVRRTTSRPVLLTLVAGVGTACVPPFVIWSFSGLENPLFALTVVALAAALVRRVVGGSLATERAAMLCGLLAAGAAMTRPDGLIYAFAFPATLTWIHRSALRDVGWVAVRYVVAFAIPVGGYLVFRLAVFGDWIPNTARAKGQGIPSVADLNRPTELISSTGWLTVLVGAVAVAFVMREHTIVRAAVATLLVPLGLAIGAFAVLRADWMAQARFSTPIWPLAALTVTLAVAHVLAGVQWRARSVAAVVLVGALALTLIGWANAATSFRRAPTAIMCSVAHNVGMTVNSYADRLGIRQGSVAAIDGGGTSLTSRLHYVDLAGLGEARIARYWQHEDMSGLRDYVFTEVRPTFIQIWQDWGTLTGITADPRLERDYVPVLSESAITGTWVRRDAVADATTLERTRAWALVARTDAVVRQMAYAGKTQWMCGPTLQPAPYPFPRPIT